MKSFLVIVPVLWEEVELHGFFHNCLCHRLFSFKIRYGSRHFTTQVRASETLLGRACNLGVQRQQSQDLLFASMHMESPYCFDSFVVYGCRGDFAGQQIFTGHGDGYGKTVDERVPELRPECVDLQFTATAYPVQRTKVCTRTCIGGAGDQGAQRIAAESLNIHHRCECSADIGLLMG